ncbi:MAG: putative DNA binding domain-containing protein [Dysgonamonadaceae bacterium]|jgi:predicted HTH transcriptional regulator|nr:putative DNA binding domain-containing protein [Dysgonamonadaceae bacterium]
MITVENIKHLIPQGETTTVQFKLRSEEAYKMGVEMVAFSNTQGGMLIIGVNDKTGVISGLSFEEIQQTNALLVNAASENVKPAIVITTETVNIDGQNVLVATIPKGKDKPYKDNKGIIWVKNGSDKRKVFSNNELRVMMQSCGTLSADSDSVAGTSYKDISEPILKNFLYKRYTEELTNAGIFGHLIQSTDIEDIVQAIDANFTIEKLLKNISLMNEAGQLTLSGLLLLGKSIQRYKPVFTIKGVSFVGNSVATTEFRDKLPNREVEGNLLKQYESSISFINRNLKAIQIEKEFNSTGQLEIPLEVFVETLTNAFIHRDYYINSPIRLFVFDNRIEIHSPGILPDSVTEETIKQGISVPRNQLLFDNAKYLLPYTGIGSGIMRAMKSYDKILFQNNIAIEEFVITILRDETIEDMNNDTVNLNNDTVNLNNDTVNRENDIVNQKSERVREIFERVKIENERVKNELIQVYSFIEQNPLVKIVQIEKFNKKSNITNKRYLKILKDNGLIEYTGSDKTGGYRVVAGNG